MRRTTHLLLGALAFLAYTYLLDLLLDMPVKTVLMGFFTALFGSIMPDILEPARHRNHRGICHSRRAMRVAATIFAVAAIAVLLHVFIPDPALSYLVSVFFLGYAVHLLADSLTPAGLPG